jgi:hypothetical protein
MKIKFTNPCPTGVSEGKTFLNKSKLKYSTQKGDKIICPYNGDISKVNSNDVVIKHVVNNQEWESKLSGFYPTVRKGEKVSEGHQIGFTINGTFTFEVNPSVNVEELISFGVNSSKYHGKSSDKTNDGNKSNYKSNDSALDGLLKIFLSPVSFVQGALNLEQEVIEKSNIIKEDINNIKKLF